MQIEVQCIKDAGLISQASNVNIVKKPKQDDNDNMKIWREKQLVHSFVHKDNTVLPDFSRFGDICLLLCAALALYRKIDVRVTF